MVEHTNACFGVSFSSLFCCCRLSFTMWRVDYWKFASKTVPSEFEILSHSMSKKFFIHLTLFASSSSPLFSLSSRSVSISFFANWVSKGEKLRTWKLRKRRIHEDKLCGTVCFHVQSRSPGSSCLFHAKTHTCTSEILSNHNWQDKRFID